MRVLRGAAAAAVLALAAVAPAGVASGAPTGQGDLLTFSLKAAMEDPKVAAKLAPGVKLYFGDEPATVVKEIGPTRSERLGVRPARRTPISSACVRVAGNALIAISADAKAKGGNAVVGIRSAYQDRATDNPMRFECAMGLQMVTVVLTGTIAVVE